MDLTIIHNFYNNTLAQVKKHLPVLSEQEKKITYIACAALGAFAVLEIAKLLYRSFTKLNAPKKNGKNTAPVVPLTITRRPFRKNIKSKTTPQPIPNKQPATSETEIPKAPKEPIVPNNIPIPPPPPGPPPPPPLPMGNENKPIQETPAARHLRLENNKLKRHKTDRLKLVGVHQEGSLLKINDLEKLQMKINHCEEIIEDYTLAIKGAANPELEKKIELKKAEIEEINERVKRSKVYQIKLPHADFSTYLNRLTTDELKLIWGCFQQTQPQDQTPDPLIEFYESYPDQEMRKICTENQAIYKSLFENCSKLFIDTFKKLIEDREKGVKQDPTYAPAPYNPLEGQKQPAQQLGGGGNQLNPNARNALLAELRNKAGEVKDNRGKAPITPVRGVGANPAQPGDHLDELKKKLADRNANPNQAAQIPRFDNELRTQAERLATPPPKALRRVINQLAPEREAALRIGYMLEKFESMATLVTKANFDHELSDLTHKKDDLVRSLTRLSVIKQVPIRNEIQDLQTKIDQIGNNRKLAEDYLKHPFIQTSNLDEALQHEFIKQNDLKDKAEEYAKKKIDEIRNR